MEGPSSDAGIEALRNHQIKNLFTLDMLASGTPMLLMGDEVRRTQQGNNNVYCQDNDIGWFDWRLLERHADLHRFVKTLNSFRRWLEVLDAGTLTLNELLWHGVTLNQPDWSEHSRSPSAASPRDSCYTGS